MRVDWPNEDIAKIRKALADGIRPYVILQMFPDRNTRAVRAKIFYEKHYAFDSSARQIAKAADTVADPDEAASNQQDANIHAFNVLQDGRFQAALTTAIALGLEQMPIPGAPHGEFRPAHFVREPGLSFGRSPALCCAELGSR